MTPSKVAGLMAPALLLVTPACASPRVVRTTGVRTLDLAEFEAESQVEMWSPPREGVILRVPAGTVVPLDINISLPFARVEPGENRVAFTSDVYIFMSPEKFMISPDAERWAEMGNWKAMKKLFGFDRGTLGVGLGVVKDKGAFMNLTVETVSLEKE